ncbi:hypothetical protein ABPG75_000578 [Micractinium tetrahymenae]
MAGQDPFSRRAAAAAAEAALPPRSPLDELDAAITSPLDRARYQAKANQKEALSPGEHAPEGLAPPRALAPPGGRQVVPAPWQALPSKYDFSELNADNPPPAARGTAQQHSKRHDRLLGVSGGAGGHQRQQQGAARQGGKQQQREPTVLASACKLCYQPPSRDSTLRLAMFTDDKQEVAVCHDCFDKNSSSLQPVVLRQSQALPGGGKQQQQPQQPRLVPLSLQPSIHGSQARQAQHAAHFVAGGEQLPQLSAARGPSRGKGKQPGPARKRKSDSDEEYDDAKERRQQQQRQGQGQVKPSGRYGLLQGDGSDSELEAMIWRQQPATRRKQQQAANAEPVLIDLLSDDDHGAGGEQQGAAAAAAAAEVEEVPARRTRPARAAAYRSTAERFKGLKCLYPPGGGPGAVEVTFLDLPRLDQDEFLNDTVIDFYLRWLQDQLPPEVAQRCYFFNSFFFKKLTETSGGSLSEEVEAYAKRIEAKGEKLQTLRNHQKVKKWTKDVDLFAKDFIFVPVHEALHWSLMVVCHPGVVLDGAVVDLEKKAGEGGGSAGKAGKAGDKASPGAALKPGQPTPCILHMDSIKGSHHMARFANKLRLYLEFEWDLKALQGPSDSVPARWAAAHPGLRRRWYNNDFPARSLKVPKQDNHCDCGLFMCSYPEFLTYRLPRVINLDEVSELNGSYLRTNKDLYEGTDYCYPGLLTERWFPNSNPTNLRYEMRRQILELMAEQQGLGVRREDGEWEWRDGDPLAEEVAQELLDLNSRLATEPYVRPREWESQAQTQKRERALRLAHKQLEEEERKAKRQQRQSAAAKRPSGDSVNSELLAAAAERRMNGGAGASALLEGIKEVAAQASDDSQGGFEREHLPRGGRPPGAEQRLQQQDAQAELQPAFGTQPDASQPWDDGFEVDLSDEEGRGAHGQPASAAREIVQEGFERQLVAQGAAQQVQQARQRQDGWHAVLEGSDAGEEEGARGAHPGSPPRGWGQQQQEDESPPPARKRARTQRKRQQPAARQPEGQQAIDLSGSPAEAQGAAGDGTDSLATTQDVGGSTAEESDGELDIMAQQPAALQPPASPPALQQQEQPQQQQQSKRRRTSDARPFAPVAQDRSGRAVEVDWSQVALVAGVLWDASDGSGKQADVRIWYKDKAVPEQHAGCPAADGTDYHLSIPFLAPSIAASVEQLRAWQGRHAEELGRLDSSRRLFQQIDELEQQLAVQAAAGQLAPQDGPPRQPQAHSPPLQAQQMQAPEAQPQPPGSAQGRRRQKRQRQAAEAGGGTAVEGGEEEEEESRSIDLATGVGLQSEHSDAEAGGAALAAAEEGMEGLHLDQQQQQQQQQPWTAAAKQAAAAAAAAEAAAEKQQEEVVDMAGEEDEHLAAGPQQHASPAAAHQQEQEAGPPAGDKKGSKRKQQPAQQQQQQQQQPEPLGKLPRKPSQPKHNAAAKAGGGPPQQPQQPQPNVATLPFHRFLYEARPAAEAAAPTEPAVPGQPPAPFGGLPTGRPQPPPALQMMHRAGSDVLQHAEPYTVGRPSSAADGALVAAKHGWRRKSDPSSSGSGGQQQQQQAWEPGRPAALDPRMAAPRPLASTAAEQQRRQVAAAEVAAAVEQATLNVQHRWPQQAPAALSGDAVRGASAGVRASMDLLLRQQEQAKRNKLLSRKQHKQQAEPDVITLD